MRVLHWYPNFGGGGGVANAVESLAHAQAELGAEVAIAFARARGPRLYDAPRAEGVTLHEWQPLSTIDVAGLTVRLLSRREARKLRALAPDIVHVHGEFAPDNLRVPRLFGAPIVLSPHGAFHPLVLGKSRATGKRSYIRVASPLLYRRSLIHAMSPAERADVEGAVPGARCYVVSQGAADVPHGVPPARGANGPTTLLFVGRLDVYTKGLDLLLDAFAAARNTRPELRLRLAGPNWNDGRQKLERRIADLGIGGVVELLGALPRSQVAAELAAADMYVQLSRHEGFPLSVADALATGMPAVLSSAIGIASFPELAALAHIRLVPPEANAGAAAIAEVASLLPALRAEADAARDFLRTFFSWNRISAEHLRRYGDLVAATSPASVGRTEVAATR